MPPAVRIKEGTIMLLEERDCRAFRNRRRCAGAACGAAAGERADAGRFRHAPGFTLIELLVVVAIISLLLTILTPSFQTAILMAQEATCLNNCRQIAYAQLTFQGAHQGRFCTDGDDSRTDGFLDRYKHNDNMYNGPNCLGDVLYWGGYIDDLKVFHCPDDDDPLNFPEERPYKLSYGLNGYLGDDTIQDVRRPATKIFMGETRGNGLHTVGCWNFRAPGIRHTYDRGCYIYFDAHADIPQFEEVWDHPVDPDIPRRANGEVDLPAHWQVWFPNPPKEWHWKTDLNAELFPHWAYWIDE
jgi:prepilin-type N-terminal cleavage/methylation domain-containing protein